MSRLDAETIKQITEIAAKRGADAAISAYRKEHETDEKKKQDRLLYKTRVILEKYRYLKDYADNAVYSLKKVEELDDDLTMPDFKRLMGIGVSQADSEAYSLKRGAAIAKILISHVDRMLAIYRTDCETSASLVRKRQWRVVYSLYLSEKRMNTAEIANAEGEELRTIQNDAKQARDDLTALFFGINGVLLQLTGDE